MSQLKSDGPRLANFEVGRSPLKNSQELLAEVEEEVSARRRNPDATVSPPSLEGRVPRKFVLNVIHSCASDEGFESGNEEQVERQTDVILIKERFDKFFADTGLQVFVDECFEDAFRDGQFDRGVSQKDFIKTYFITPKAPSVAVQEGRSLYWKLLAEKTQLRDEYAKLRHDKSMRDHFEHTPTLTGGTIEPAHSESLTAGESSNDNAKCPYGFKAGSSKEYKWKGEEFTFDEFDFFYEDKLYDYEVMHDMDEERAKAEKVKAEVAPSSLPVLDTSTNNLKAKDKGHVNPSSSKSTLDKDGVKSAKSRNHSDKEGHTGNANKH